MYLCIQGIAVVNSGLLLMAVMGILFPAVLYYTHSEVHTGSSELALSRFSSCIMLIAYAAYLFFQLKSQSSSYSRLEEVCFLTFVCVILFDLDLFSCLMYDVNSRKQIKTKKLLVKMKILRSLSGKLSYGSQS